MTPADQLRALRDEQRWEPTRLQPRSIAPGPLRGHRRSGRLLPVIVTALVAVLVIAGSISALRLASMRANDQPAATGIPGLPGATAVIRGTTSTTTRMIAGVGTPSGPTGAELQQLQALATRTGKLTGLPNPSRGYQTRLAAAVHEVRAAFGSAAHEFGGFGHDGFFLVLNRTPTDDELQLLRLLPMTVRLHWGPRISVADRDRQQQAAFAALQGITLDGNGYTNAETDTQVFTYWPDRDHPRTARQIADRMAAVITRISGAAPTFTIRVTDRSRTPAGQAALQATGRTTSNNGIRLLIGSRPTHRIIGVGLYGGAGLGLNTDHCVALGDSVIIAPPGSSISTDGQSVHAKGIGNFPVRPRSAPANSRADAPTSGAFIDAKTAATYLPPGSTLCNATRFLLIG